MSFFRMLVRVHGSLLIGGHGSVPEGMNGAHARLAGKRPVIPATALRGALRESLEALLRGAEVAACGGGDGSNPGDETSSKQEGCQLDHGKPCRACQLFGGGRARLLPSTRSFSALVLGEGLPLDRQAFSWGVRHGVAIDRRRGSAMDKRVFRREVPTGTLVFEARGRLTSDDAVARSDFAAAVRATTHLGAGRTGGLGRVDMELEWEAESPARAHSSIVLPAGDDVELVIKLETGASLGLPMATGYFRDTRRCIPGSALRGAIGFALAETLADPNDPAFQSLVHEQDGAIFDFLYPVRAATERSAIVGPWPLTARVCKADAAHGVVDTLLDRLAISCLRSLDEVARVGAGIRETCGVDGCDQVLRSPEGERAIDHPPPVTVTTRVAMDRQRGSARDHLLFSHALIERGTHFVGTIRRIPERSRHRLVEALSRPLSVGRGRAMGWGAISVATRAPLPLPSIAKRAANFDHAMKRRFEELGLIANRSGRLIVFTLLSPLLPVGPEDDGTAELADALGAPLEWPVRVRRFDLERGWDQRHGLRDTARSVRAGSVFVGELAANDHWESHLQTLLRIEQQGIGKRTRLGFGRVLCFDPFVEEGSRKRED